MSNDLVSRRRRALIRCASAAAIAALATPAVGAGVARAESGKVDVHIVLEAVPDQVQVLPGTPTRVWRYRGKLLQGEASAFDASAGTYLGPIIRVRRGQRVRVDLINHLPESTIVHWHGLHVPEAMDGHPRFAIAPGERYVYDFTVVNRAGTYWFHPHPHGRTGAQVYFGLAGLFLVSDDEEAGLALPTGADDLPLVIQDRAFDADNQLVYLSESISGAGASGSRDHGMMGGGSRGGMRMGSMGGMGSMMAAMMGVLGDRILVNGRAAASIAVPGRPHRLRLLNASNTRTCKLAWSDGSPLTVIGTDGGLLAAPQQRSYVMLSPAERVDLWVDFGHWPAGSDLALQSLPFEGGMEMGDMMGGMRGGARLRDGAAFQVLTLRIGDSAAARARLPERLALVPPPDARMAVNADRPKVFTLTMGMMTWGVDGRGFDMRGASSLETVQLGTSEVWEFRNDDASGMMGMTMPHSMHVHGLQFRVLERSVDSRFGRAYDSVKAGFVDDGWKDTVLVMPGERVRILLRFADHPGLFLYHCHMLEHEDSGLMRNYRIKA